VARLRSDGTPFTLTLAGDGAELEALKAQVRKLGLAEARSYCLGECPKYTLRRHTIWQYVREKESANVTF
jgi:hypothetical protein